jgi:hypothetical protein
LTHAQADEQAWPATEAASEEQHNRLNQLLLLLLMVLPSSVLLAVLVLLLPEASALEQQVHLARILSPLLLLPPPPLLLVMAVGVQQQVPAQAPLLMVALVGRPQEPSWSMYHHTAAAALEPPRQPPVSVAVSSGACPALTHAQGDGQAWTATAAASSDLPAQQAWLAHEGPCQLQPAHQRLLLLLAV